MTPSEPSESVSQKEAEPKEGEDSGPVLETAKLPAEVEDDVKDKDAPSEEVVPEAGGRRTPRRKPSGLAADKASRVPLLKGVCSSCCPGLAWLPTRLPDPAPQLAATSTPAAWKWPGPVL